MQRRFLIAVILISLWAELSFSESVHITLLQANDVYEITPLDAGQYGGLARVETIKKSLIKKNPNTFTVLAGDLFSPSAIGTAKVNGKRLNGQQMVAVLNAMNWDYITLGNHEFDNGYNSLVERLAEASFKTVSSNVLDTKLGNPFANTLRKDVVTIKGVRVGFAGITLPSTTKGFVTIQNPFETAKAIIEELKVRDGVDIVILITHQEFEDDVKFAQQLKGVDLIVGGHEHKNVYVRRGAGLVPIAKADANARTVYIHDLRFDTKTKELDIESKLKIVDGSVKQDEHIKSVVDDWVGRAYEAFKKEGLEPEKIVCNLPVPLDGLEASVRYGTTSLTRLIAKSALVALPGSQASVYNSGAIRVDDILPPGNITQYDIVRILPFSGTAFEQVLIPGDILKQALTVGVRRRGTGSFLQYANIQFNDGRWELQGEKISDDKEYRIAIASYLVNRGDKGLEFLVNNPRIKKLSDTVVDARLALINQIMRACGE